MAAPRQPYPDDPGPIGSTPQGCLVALGPMTADAAAIVGAGLAAIDPWARVGRTASAMQSFLAQVETGAKRYQIGYDGQLAGTLVVRDPWLHGPYLHLIGLLPPYPGKGIGGLVLQWFENEARGRYRNLWLCVSDFNTNARRLYERQGYTLAANLDGLVFDGMSECLMRKPIA